jgi:TolB-like protein
MTVIWQRRACLLASLVVLMGATFVVKPRGSADEDEAPPQIAILPFQNTEEALDVSALGDELAENITSTLNKDGSISVLGQDIMRREVLGEGSTEIKMNLPDVMLAAKKLNVVTLVTGRYKKVGTSLEIDCEFLDVQTGKPQEGKSIKVTEDFPKGYVGALKELSDQVEKQFRPSAASTSRPKLVVPSESSSNFDAHQCYASGLQRSKFKTIDALTDARDSYRQALKADSNYAQAYAAKSDAETQIAQIKERNGQDAKQDKLDAVEDALEAVKRAPYYGGGHWQLSRAYQLVHDYRGAELAARVAAQLWPANGEVLLDVSRAVGQGQIVDCPEFRRAVTITPSLVLTTLELPQVTVVNGGALPAQVTFTQAKGRTFTSLIVPSGGSRIVGLLAGTYEVRTVAGPDVNTKTATFENGTVYTIDGRTLVADTPNAKGTHILGPATLLIKSNVPGAKILINKKEIGTAPMEWVVDEDVAPDWTFKIEITADGYKPYVNEFHAAKGAKVPVNANLEVGAFAHLMSFHRTSSFEFLFNGVGSCF